MFAYVTPFYYEVQSDSPLAYYCRDFLTGSPKLTQRVYAVLLFPVQVTS
jgi:hypothetical protein